MSRLDPFDVIVVGGGPAGSTVATLVARAGRRVLLLDRERFPRFRIGESLMPASYWTLERLGVLERMQASPFPRKGSVQFFSRSGRGGLGLTGLAQEHLVHRPAPVRAARRPGAPSRPPGAASRVVWTAGDAISGTETVTQEKHSVVFFGPSLRK